MCAKLLILESPGKVKKVQEILGPGWKVAASVGHVRDLPQKEMGVAAPDFKPIYVPTDRGKEVLARLKLEKGDSLFVTDAANGVTLTPYNPTVDDQLRLGREFMRSYRDTFHQLAK